MVCGQGHSSLCSEKQASHFFRQRIESSGFGCYGSPVRKWRRWRAGSKRGGNQIQKCHPSRSHLLQIALRFQSRFAPSHRQVHFGICDYEFPSCAGKHRNRILGCRYRHSKERVPLYPFKAILEERSAATREPFLLISRRGGQIEIVCLTEQKSPVLVGQAGGNPDAAHQRKPNYTLR